MDIFSDACSSNHHTLRHTFVRHSALLFLGVTDSLLCGILGLIFAYLRGSIVSLTYNNSILSAIKKSTAVTSYYTLTQLFGLFMIQIDLIDFGAYLP
ncbi:hypothetical protein F9C07_1479139 [Aspergillus flavus]|uniref:Uncharacterized protein n=1 Tax=Aspergillus flavus (strain ATCC 200026 / FGSC A1120 / IAM 13836 / NRRL 3357 / JCM 12722 / SRRC 167) TaxID=332952 RepID=A0A7U2QW64_ASPFN|nr:hypothetical protein F9C07_1479139 [Aspergillus flavus]